MTSDGQVVLLTSWLLAASPVVVLLGLVLWGRLASATNAAVTVVYTVLVAGAAFGAGGEVLLVGLAKGVWVGVWILGVIWPALLLHHLADGVGMRQLGERLAALLPRPTENVLLLAWILPSFLQGVAGFGTPIAICAPLLLLVGVDPTRAVALPLVGYHWAVGFGSMGSSFYMASLTAHLDPPQTQAFATSTSIVLGLNIVVSGILVAWMWGGRRGLRDGWRLLATAGPAMALVQALAVRGEPAVGAVAAGTAGLLIAIALRVALRRAHGAAAVPVTAEDDNGDARQRSRAAALPYLVLGLVALAVFLPPTVRAWVKTHALIGPALPATETAHGFANAGVLLHAPIAVFGHPGSFLLVACSVSVLIWRRNGLWHRGLWTRTRGPWLRQAMKSSPPVLLLAGLAGLLVDSGMVHSIAAGAAAAAGQNYLFAVPFIGALGSFITGSTTSSNALFAAMQADAARFVGDQPADLLAAQIAGGNVGNSLAPMVLLLGVTALGNTTTVGQVLRRTVIPALVLLVAVLATTVTLVLAHR